MGETGVWDSLRGRLREEHFFRVPHQRIWAALARLADSQDQPADPLTLKAALATAGHLDSVGGPAYLASLTDGVPARTNAAAYAAIVLEKARLRAIIKTASAAIDSAYDAELTSEEILRTTDRAWMDLQGQLGSHADTLSAGTAAILRDLEHRTTHKGELTGLETGFPKVNSLTMGWQPGNLIVVAARSSVGKTTFAMNSLTAAARAGARVIMFSLEMKRRELEWRWLSSLSGVDMYRIRGGYLGEADLEKVGQAITEMDGLPIVIDDSANRTVQEIRSEARLARGEGGLDLVVVDYVQLMPGSLAKGGNRNDEISDIVVRLKALGDELGVPVMLLSQLNRASSARQDPRPVLTDLRDSGAIEQHADVVVLLHRRDHKSSGTTYLLLEKQRNGPTGVVHLSMDRERVTMREQTDEEIKDARAAEKEKA